jgi:muramoyltetrapeptide carboxypeptidase
MTSRVLSRSGYLAGDDARRGAELADALTAPDVKAVVAARGGYGLMRTLEACPDVLRSLTASPRWVVGFSDVTALHVALSTLGVSSVHGPNVTGLGRASPMDRAAFLAALERPGAAATWTGLHVLHAGHAGGASRGGIAGAVAGGNLALVAAIAAAGQRVVPEGAILFLEDTDERPYRVDRMLTSLRLSGALARAAAVVFGGFTRCAPGPDGVTVEDVLGERTRDLGIPVLAGAPFGHGDDNRAFVLGREAVVDDVAGEVRFLAG